MTRGADSPAAARAPGAAGVPRELRPWIGKPEEILVSVRSSVWAVLLESLGTIAFVGLLVLLALVTLVVWGRSGLIADAVVPVAGTIVAVRLIWQAIVVWCRRYILTDRYVLRVRGVFNRSAATLPIERVQHVVLVRTLLERLTGTGTLGFATAGTGGVELAWMIVDRPIPRVEEVRAVVERAEATEGRRAPVVIGLAGGIGSGKSEVARALAEMGCVVADSDRASREALDRADVRAQLVRWWGPGTLGPDGRVDRKRVASIVFSDEAERLRLEALVHPIVRQGRAELMEAACKAAAPGVVIDAPLLFEAGLDAECDAVIFVDAPRAVRERRVRESRGWAEGELERREKVQIPLDAKRRRSDYEVMNDADPAALRARVRRILDRILESDRGDPPARSRQGVD